MLPNVNFGLPSGFTASSSPTGIPNLPGFGFDSRWPFDGTDNLLTFTDNVTWIKGKHSVKAGFYFEHDARNVSVYSVYNTAGTYYFGSDLGNPVDTGNPFSNAVSGNLRLRAGQPEADQPRPLQAERVLRSGLLESQSQAHA